MEKKFENQGLYRPEYEHDSCGVGFIASIKGEKSHQIVLDGLKILENLEHRGAVGADPLMGDGSGIMLQIPDLFFRQEFLSKKIKLPPSGEYGIGMVFLPKEQGSRLACQRAIERVVLEEGQTVLGWRDVPVNTEIPMSPRVKEKEPVIRQIFIGRGADTFVQDAFERKLLVIRKLSTTDIRKLNLKHGKEFYFCSLSSRLVLYKGLLLSNQVGPYFPDLSDYKVTSSLALVHQRFSTNTFPEWSLAQPFRLIAHNGEINTVKGNYNWLKAREGVMSSPFFGEDLNKLFPISDFGQSDTAIFDNCLELLVASGYSLAQAVMMMIPEPWEQNKQMPESRRAFYEYHAAMMEPWDGPASIVFTDGKQIGATLDRNGLRPSRYCITDDGLVIMASETGVLPVPESKVVRKWRLQPGKMFLIDLEEGKLIDDDELKETISRQKPYRNWIENLTIKLGEIKNSFDGQDTFDYDTPLSERQMAFGYTKEDIKYLLGPMCRDGQEGIGSMGNDTPLAVLSSRSKPIFNYFKQLFAQVTNPPIDPIREAIVMSLVNFIGPRPNLLDINQTNPPLRIEISQPILGFEDMAKIKNIDVHTSGKFKSFTLDISYPVSWGSEGVEAKLSSLCADAVDAVKDGFNIIIISDKNVSSQKVAVPSLLALSAVHQHLVKEGLRTSTGIVVETGLAREVHHFAVLAGYGAEAIHPYLALETIKFELAKFSVDLNEKRAVANYIQAIGKGLMKIMSKMGISTYMSYCGAQIFEGVGLSQETVDKYFCGTSTAVGGVGIFEIAEEMIRLHKLTFKVGDKNQKKMLPAGGEYEWRVGGEEHMWTPDAIASLQHAVRGNQWESFKQYAQIINDQSTRHMTLRGLFSFKVDPTKAIPLDSVEPASEIVKRFATGAMSLGSISTEAHTTLAVAMNRLGGKSNTGEGGEDRDRYMFKGEFDRKVEGDNETLATRLKNAGIQSDFELKRNDSLRSKIKQVASGRFGVTAEYLSSADQIQIKMAQGAKPGEGGQLPGGKVSDYIGSLRYSVPGVGLISPPPHHDIYSIEDLAQLIHDLKNVAPIADISVKLVSEIGVGTVAAGVAKSKADHLVIAGHDGGTGASPLSSIKHCGSPWEIGLAETQQTLVLNGLRSRIRVQVDGQMKTGRDVVIAALLGADEMGFATAPLVAEGCIMMRKCHLNTCPVGIATQDPELRKRYAGTPEHVVNYFFFIAEEVRQIMAQLGASRFEELVGRADLLETNDAVLKWKAKGIDFAKIFFVPACTDQKDKRQSTKQNHGLEKALDKKLIERIFTDLRKGESLVYDVQVANINRTVGAMLSGELAKKYPKGIGEKTIRINCNGTGGQSFGAFLTKGVTLNLSGEANDYTGKGLSGGTIIVKPHKDFIGPADRNIIVGNTVLYGATSGKAFFSGVAGERFCVRLSGASAVVEGVGDHGCEYMTGGTVVILGETGRNFAAGMSGGVAFVFDESKKFALNCNQTMVDLVTVEKKNNQKKAIPSYLWHTGKTDDDILKSLIEEHFENTQSPLAKRILNNWDNELQNFIKVFPKEYQRALKELSEVNSDKERANV